MNEAQQPPSGGAPHAPSDTSDLRPRMIAGAVMAAVAIALAWAGLAPFGLLVLVATLLMCWEWGRVVRGTDFGAAFYVHALAVAVAVVLSAAGYPALGLVAIVTGFVVLLVMPSADRRLMSAAGALYIGLPGVAILWLRGDEPLGFLAIAFIFAVVWGSDIGAFAAGRGLGGPKLWPRVSPKKTWSGFVGGLTAGLICGALVALAVPDASPRALGATGMALALVAQMGDLAESALKRRFGVKDSSTIIPGHGGVMDRADSTVAVCVVVAIVALLVNPASPARALLIGG